MMILWQKVLQYSWKFAAWSKCNLDCTVKTGGKEQTWNLNRHSKPSHSWINEEIVQSIKDDLTDIKQRIPKKTSKTTLKINVMKIHSTTAGLVSIWKRNFPLKFVKTEWGIFSAHFAVSVHIWFRSLHHLIITRKRTPLFLISGRGTRYTFNTHLKSIALKKRS